MTILYLHQYFKFPYENGGTRSYDLARSFAKEGYNVIVISSTDDKSCRSSQRWSVKSTEGIEIHRIYLPYGNHLPYLQRILIFLQFIWFASFRLLKIKADVVLATSTPLTIGIPALIKKWLGKTPYIFEVRDVWPEAVIAIGAIKNPIFQKILIFLEQIIYRYASFIVPLSTDMKQSIITRFPKVKEKVSVVIENIAEINRFQVENTTINLSSVIGFTPRFSVLYAGTFGKVNGIHEVLELALKTLHLDRSLVYILMGNGAEKANVIETANRLKVLNKNVFILDPVPKNDLPKWYRGVSMGSSFVADIPELWANSANKFFDTLAAGKPILINHEGWQAETIRTRNVGYVLPSKVTDSAALDFIEYSHKRELIANQENLALELATEKYSLEVATKKYFKVLKSF